MDDRTERPVFFPQGGAHKFVIEDDETESELSLESRSFLHRVNDQVRQRQKQSSMDATEDSEEHSMIWECSCLQQCKHLYSWKEFLRQLPFHHENKRSHIETNVRHIYKIGVSLDWKQLVGRIIHGNTCLWLVMNKSSVFSAQKSTYFQILYCFLVRYTRTPNRTLHGNKDWSGSKVHQEYRTLDRLDGEQMEFEWNIFPGFNTLQLSQEVQELLLRLSETPENFTGRIIFMSMFNDISWRSRDNMKECESSAQLVSLLAKRFGARQWSFIGPGSEKKWYSISEDSPQGEWDKMAEKWWWHTQKADTQSFEPRAHCPEVLQKAKAVKNCRFTIAPIRKRLQLFFAQLLL